MEMISKEGPSEMVLDSAVVLWSADPEAERLTAHSIAEAVQEWAERQYPTPIDALPETVEVHGYTRKQLPEVSRQAARILEMVLEDLDEELGDPEEGTAPTDEMEAAARAFVEAVYRDYEVWRCEATTTRTVRVRDYYNPANDATAEADEDVPDFDRSDAPCPCGDVDCSRPFGHGQVAS